MMDIIISQPAVRLGTAIREITPPTHVALAGFASRQPPNNGVSRPLYVRTWVFETINGDNHESRKALFVQADIIWWGTERLERLREKLRSNWLIAPEMIMFHASHTHGGPQTGKQFNDVLGVMDASYMDFLEHQVELAVATAHSNLESVTMETGSDQCEGISINRRKLISGIMEMAPNPNGVNDKAVTVIRFVAKDKRTKGIWFHFTCHPTTTGNNLATSEYCGAAMEQLDDEFGRGVSCFLQGCCGDIRPSLVLDNQFFSGDDSDVLRNGAKLAACVQGILHKPMKLLKPIPLEASRNQAILTFQKVPTLEELQPDPGDDVKTTAWKKLMLSGNGKLQPNVTFHVQLLRFAEGLSLLAMDGEVVVEYGLLIRRLSQGCVLPLGYSNGMVGYVPTAEQIREGGYESVNSFKLFGYPSPFTTDVESSIEEAICKVLTASK